MNEGELMAEYGSSQPFQFWNAILVDSEGNEILCKCGKPAGSAIIGKEAYLAQCSKCAGYGEGDEAKFVFKPEVELSEAQKEKLESLSWMFEDDIAPKR